MGKGGEGPEAGGCRRKDFVLKMEIRVRVRFDAEDGYKVSVRVRVWGRGVVRISKKTCIEN